MSGKTASQISRASPALALTGFVLEATGKFVAPFAIIAAIYLAGALAWVFVVGRVDWGPGLKSRALSDVWG